MSHTPPDELEDDLFIAMLKLGRQGAGPEFDLPTVCENSGITASKQQLIAFTSDHDGILGNRSVTMNYIRFTLNAEGRRYARALEEQRRPKTVLKRLSEVPRSDWIAGLALVVSVGFCSVDALSQNPAPVAQWPGAEIADGIAFQGDGAVTLEASPETGTPVLTFWRPVLHDEDTRYPVAGRMDCRVAATEVPFSDAAFDPEARHAAVKDSRKERGFIDTDRKSTATDTTRQLDIIGRRNAPRSYYVLSYIMLRNGDRLIDVRRNCTFIFGSGASKPDVLPLVNRYTRLITAFSEQDS